MLSRLYYFPHLNQNPECGLVDTQRGVNQYGVAVYILASPEHDRPFSCCYHVNEETDTIIQGEWHINVPLNKWIRQARGRHHVAMRQLVYIVTYTYVNYVHS